MCVKALFIWSNGHIRIPHNLFDFKNMLYFIFKKELKRVFRIIWHVTIWAIWKARNDIIFKNGVLEVVDDIKRLSWNGVYRGLKFSRVCIMSGYGIRGGVLVPWVAKAGVSGWCGCWQEGWRQWQPA